MKKLTTMLLTILLASCVQIPYRPIKVYSWQFQKCTIRCFDYNKLGSVDDRFCGETFVSGDYHVSECDGIIGSDAGVYTRDIKPVVIKNIRACNNRN